MTDTTTKKPLRVSSDGTAGPYIWLPYSQLEDLRRLLDSHGIYYWATEHAISFDGGPEMIIVNLGRDGNGALVQKILDNAL